MRIVRISAFGMTLPLRRPYELQGGRLRFEQLDSTMVRIDTDEGVSGWGEACPWGSTYLPAFPRGIHAGIEEFGPVLIGQDPRRTDVVNSVMDTALPGHPYVKSAIDIACWDILGKATGLPVCELLGGRQPGDVTIQSSIPSADPPEMLRNIERFAAKGYTIHSAKVGSGVAADIERIEYLAERMPAGSSLTIDVNRAWIPDQATPARYRRGTWFCHEMITVDPIIGGARNLGGVTRAPEAPGLGAEPDREALGRPLLVIGG